MLQNISLRCTPYETKKSLKKILILRNLLLCHRESDIERSYLTEMKASKSSVVINKRWSLCIVSPNELAEVAGKKPFDFYVCSVASFLSGSPPKTHSSEDGRIFPPWVKDGSDAVNGVCQGAQFFSAITLKNTSKRFQFRGRNQPNAPRRMELGLHEPCPVR